MTKRIRVAVSPYMGKLIDGVAKLMSRSEPDALELLLFRIETAARHGKLADFGFGLEWGEVAAVLNVSGLGVAAVDSISVIGEEIPFDVNLLDRSSRTKSGFAGVFVTGSGSFRALVPDPEKGGSRHLQSHPTALQAAIDRYEWFSKHALPYGDLGTFVDEHIYSQPSETVLDALMMARGLAGKLKLRFTIEQVEATIKQYLAIKGLPPEAAEPPVIGPPKRPPMVPIYTDPAVAAARAARAAAAAATAPAESSAPIVELSPVVEPTEDEACAVCAKPIRADDRFTFLGKTEKAVHTSCIDYAGNPKPKSQTATR